MNNKIKIGIIGCGRRSENFLQHIKELHNNKWELTALCDPGEHIANTLKNKYGNKETKYFSDSGIMLDEMEFDGVIIASPNKYHYEPAMKLLHTDKTFFLEKPVAVTPEECRNLLSAYKKSKSRVVLGFVLRYTPFYSKVKKIIDSGTIGEILTVNATESVNRNIVLMCSRNWRKDINVTGPFILEKCCHDFDIFNWLIGSKVEKVSSFKYKTYFTSERQPALKCCICAERENCIYSVDYNVNTHIPEHKQNDSCVFDSKIQHPDHQVVSISYKNGALVNFTSAWAQPTETRTIHIMGTKGVLYGDAHKNQITVTGLKDMEYETKNYTIINDSSGHHGGDSVIADAFFKTITGKKNIVKAGIKEGIEAALIALAADISCETDKIIRIDDI